MQMTDAACLVISMVQRGSEHFGRAPICCCEDPGESLSAHWDFVMGDIVLVIWQPCWCRNVNSVINMNLRCFQYTNEHVTHWAVEVTQSIHSCRRTCCLWLFAGPKTGCKHISAHAHSWWCSPRLFMSVFTTPIVRSVYEPIYSYL